MIDHKSVQAFLKTEKVYSGAVDGIFGPMSRAATRSMLLKFGFAESKLKTWTDQRQRIAVEQIMFTRVGIDPGKKIVVDGIAGPVYQYALELWQNHLRDVEPPKVIVASQPDKWPRQKDIVKFYGQPGQNQTMLKTPYKLYLDWDLSVSVGKFSIHEKCHDSALRVMNRVLDHYGPDKIHRMGLDQFGGCLNVRKMRGGNSMSMHSWGIAIDWDADRNALRSTSKTAMLAKPEYAKFLDFWQEEGWISLGRSRNYDWMHVQAARL